MGTFTAHPGDGLLYRPAPSERQLTFRAVFVGYFMNIDRPPDRLVDGGR